MKNKLPVITAAVITICFFLSCSHFGRRNHGMDISVSESGNIYKLRADYNEDKTGKVQRYINQQIAPNGLFASTEDYFDANTELRDRTKFYIKASPGKLLIKLDKKENTYASYARIKNMCEGIVTILKEE
jgi:hypothetical protein